MKIRNKFPDLFFLKILVQPELKHWWMKNCGENILSIFCYLLRLEHGKVINKFSFHFTYIPLWLMWSFMPRERERKSDLGRNSPRKFMINLNFSFLAFWNHVMCRKSMIGKAWLTWCNRFFRRASSPAPSRWATLRTEFDAVNSECRSCVHDYVCAVTFCPEYCVVDCCWWSDYFLHHCCSTNCCCWTRLCCYLHCCWQHQLPVWRNCLNSRCWYCYSNGWGWGCWSAWRSRGLRH